MKNVELDPKGRTADIIEQLADALDGETITLGHFMHQLSDRAFGLAILVFALPNAIPLGIPGISSVCAVPILLFSVEIMLGRHNLWLPCWLGRVSFSEKTLARILDKCLPMLRTLEKCFKPRLHALTTGWPERCVGLLIAILAFIIFLPIPFGNFVPALCMCLLALGIIERDGLIVLAGMIASFLTIGGMAALIAAVLELAWTTLQSFIA